MVIIALRGGDGHRSSRVVVNPELFGCSILCGVKCDP